jgi:hypothetical protein
MKGIMFVCIVKRLISIGKDLIGILKKCIILEWLIPSKPLKDSLKSRIFLIWLKNPSISLKRFGTSKRAERLKSCLPALKRALLTSINLLLMTSNLYLKYPGPCEVIKLKNGLIR